MHVPSPRPRLSRVLLTLLVVLLGLVAVAPVRAHAELESATPGPDETVEGPPVELLATFTEPLDAGSTSIEVLDADGNEIAAGGEPGDAPEQWRLKLPELAPGTYEVRWAAQSTIDAHLERGTYTFTVAPAPTPTAAPTPTPEPSASASAEPTPRPTPVATPSPSPSAAPTPPTDPAADSSVLLPIVAVLVLAAGFGAWLLRRRSA